MANAKKLLWKNGYNGTSIRDIARASGCTPANIYNYYQTKDDILYDILLEGHEILVRCTEKIVADERIEPIERLQAIIKAHVMAMLREKRSGKMLMDSTLVHLAPDKRKKIIEKRNAYERMLCSVLQDNIDSGVLKATNVKLVVYMLASMCNRTRLWFSPKGELSAEEIGEFIFDLIINGLRMPHFK